MGFFLGQIIHKEYTTIVLEAAAAALASKKCFNHRDVLS
jgi:hypothetical protein